MTDPVSRDGSATGTSIFDPVLCELMYRWFAPKGGVVLDPFAGGSVRGIVAAMLGLHYIGFDLSSAQIAANREQAAAICPPSGPQPEWIVGDSRAQVSTLPVSLRFDYVLSCPPYHDLEVYSEDARDLSRMSWEGFRTAYAEIIAACLARLRSDRFACFVVGDIRNKATGFYRNLPAVTVAAFESAGAGLYNDAVLLTSIGSLPIRTSYLFPRGRKLGRAHQNVLVFAKGDPMVASRVVGDSWGAAEPEPVRSCESQPWLLTAAMPPLEAMP